MYKLINKQPHKAYLNLDGSIRYWLPATGAVCHLPKHETLIERFILKPILYFISFLLFVAPVIVLLIPELVRW